MLRSRKSSLAIVALQIGVSALAMTQAYAQGCEPIRFTAPVNLGGEGQVYQRARHWQLTMAYRRLVSDDWFVGTTENSALAPGGTSPVFRIHTVVAQAGYSLTDRIHLSASVPFSTGSLARTWPDGAFHVQRATGVGDVTVLGESWLLAPLRHERGNVALGLGVKAPTGSHTLASTYYAASGAVTFPADQTIQPGDGGWAVVLQGKAFRQVTDRTHLYAFASYMMSPKAASDVRSAPTSGPHWSVPDVYSSKAGAAFSLLPDRGVTISLGGRIDGIPVRDLLGGGDDSTTKRTSHVIFADPGVSMEIGNGTLNVSVPYRVSVNRKKSLLEQRTNGLNAGGFAKYLVFAAYTYRM
jgi:hypothetical protein